MKTAFGKKVFNFLGDVTRSTLIDTTRVTAGATLVLSGTNLYNRFFGNNPRESNQGPEVSRNGMRHR